MSQNHRTWKLLSFVSHLFFTKRARASNTCKHCAAQFFRTAFLIAFTTEILLRMIFLRARGGVWREPALGGEGSSRWAGGERGLLSAAPKSDLKPCILTCPNQDLPTGHLRLLSLQKPPFRRRKVGRYKERQSRKVVRIGVWLLLRP